ncbi:DNA polymerase I [Theileria orientalis strain Shintoku]|uniref:DNA polymerase I n=1 Tax=Theileria orientalis strain Shintoku TaxID=869250 RepID=J4DNF7_THEOR|nr:DNA polymerase I [Theileria orientalis strain Shintoku]BAM38879.1 DNA polymerase I [Theileria orientalis strain Shintoku]|eukprot:XP_009689180.1 DNA polymerase I [Theileria orientalis strain Shintoku]
MEAKCHKNHIYTEPACKRNDYISRSCGILRLIGRYKVAFLFFLTRLILISCVVPRFSECIRTDRINSQFLSKIKTENVNSCNICKIVDSPLESFGKHSRYKMSKLSRLKPYCAISRLKRLNRNYLFLENLSKIKLNRILKAYEPQGQNYGSTYQSSYTVGPQSYGPSYGPGYAQSPGPREDFYTFVSSHYRNMGEDIVEYLNRKKIEYTESPLKYTLKFCPFCPPHRFKSDNLFKHEIFKNSGNSYCHRCGYKGSLFDFKAHMGDLPGAFDLASDPISSPFGQKKMPKDPEVTIEDVNKFEDNLYNNQEYRVVYEYLTKTRGIKPQVLRKYHVGAGTFKFKSMTGKLEQEKCVVFPWLMSPNTRSSVIGGDIENMTGQSEDQSGSEVFDYNQAGSEKLIVNRIKVRSIYDKGKMKILPRGGTWGMFGGHLIKEALEKDSIVLSEGEFDAMSIFQETGRVAASLPNGANSLPLALLPKLEKFNQIYLWMDFDAAGQSSISHFANKLGIQRVKVVHPINTPATTQATGAAGLDKTQGSKGKTKSAVEKGVKGKGQVSTGGGNSADGTAAEGSTGAFITKSMKDANEVMLSRSVDMETYFKNATVLSHSQILSFNDIRQLVYNELSDPISTCGIKSITMPGLSNLLKGHRRGELTVWTGSTGSGKTTLLSQLSLDYCLQGVSTLWGSFEINNVRLAKTMLRQFSGRNLENNLNEFDYYANKFNELPLRFLKFHGSTNIDIVLDAMDYAVYVHDVQHIIIDNLQFMLSNYSTPSATSGHGGSGYSSVKDVYELQNRTIEKFRRFVTNKNVHLSLVVHPRKEADGIQLGLSSVFGSVKSTQEADNVIILQNILNESRCIDVKKNRFAGLLGRVYFKFDPVSLTAQEFKVTEYLNEYITNGGSGGGMSKVSKAKAGGKEQSKSELGAKGNYEYRDKVILSNYKVGPGATSPPNKEFPTNLNAVPANNTSSGSSANVGTVVTGSNKGTSAPRMNATGSPTYTQTASAGSPSTYTTTSSAGSASQATSSYRPFVATTMNSTSSSGSPYNNYRERERNNIGLVGIDLLNLSPVSQQINKIIQSNYSTSSGTSADAGNGTAMELSGDDNKLSNTNEPQGDGKKKRGRKGIKEGTADGEELGDCLRMRGITINKNSSIKEMREFVKKNGLGELVKTAGKGLKKDTIYENIKAIIPKSAIITASASPSDYGGQYEGTEVDGMKEGAPGEEVYPFGISTSESLMRKEHQRVMASTEVEQFKLKYLTKLPKSLYPEKDQKRVTKEEDLGVETDVYYSASYDPLLMDGVIYVDDWKKLESMEPLFRRVKLVGVDIETTGLDYNNNKIRLIQISSPNQPTVILDLFKIRNNTVASGPEVTKVFHNGKFDINFLRVYGFEFGGKIFDTMIASKILVASRYISCKLTHVSERYLNIVLDKTQQYSDWSTLQLFEEQLLYSARDAFVLLPLYVILEHLLKINKLSDIAEVENKCILATSDMELNGIEVDKRKLEALQNELMEEHTQISDKMHQQLEEEDINLNSQKQLLEKLQELRIMDKSRRKLISDTSEATLIRNASNPIIATLREYRKANKALTAFTQKLPNHINEQTNRIYPNYNQLGAESGRFSCDGPNLQQVPREKKFRECFVASKGNKFVIADFSQIELRIAAEIANDAKMIQAYQEHVDLHSLTASILKSKSIEEVTKEERQLAKAVNFGLIFGMSVNGLRMYAETGYKVKLSQQESKEIYTSFFNNFKGILNWHNSVKNSKPTMVRTLGNRLSVFDSFSFTRSLNYPVQGTSADITKETMARLVDLVKPLDAKIIICIHDEIILEVPERNAQKALDMLIDTMVKSGEKYLKKVPVEAMGSIGDSWADKE